MGITPENVHIDQQFEPSLNFMSKFAGRNVILTGASGAVGTQIALKLLEAGVGRLVLFVRDNDQVDERIQ